MTLRDFWHLIENQATFASWSIAGISFDNFKNVNSLWFIYTLSDMAEENEINLLLFTSNMLVMASNLLVFTSKLNYHWSAWNFHTDMMWLFLMMIFLVAFGWPQYSFE